MYIASDYKLSEGNFICYDIFLWNVVKTETHIAFIEYVEDDFTW